MGGEKNIRYQPLLLALETDAKADLCEGLF